MTAPEPPKGFDPQRLPDSGMQQPREPRNQGPNAEADRLRKMAGAAQILALVSLVIGGVVLSTVALVVALAARGKIMAYAQGNPGNASSAQALRRSVLAAIIMSAAAIALNAISLALLYPMVAEMLQSGDYTSVLGASGQSPSASSSTWG